MAATLHPSQTAHHSAHAYAPDRRPDTGHLPYLDGIRGLSALWVLVGHVLLWGGWGVSASFAPKLAVDVFMVHSGYLMVHHQRRRPLTAERFWLRRYLRIAPAYYLSLAMAVALAPWFLGGYASLQAAHPAQWQGSAYDPHHIVYNARVLWTHVTFLFGMMPSQAASTMLPDWSLSLEMQFYLAFPLLSYVLLQDGGEWVLAFLAALSAVVFEIAKHQAWFPEPSFLPLQLTYFLIGMVAADAVTRRDPRRLWLAAALTIGPVAMSRSPVVPLVVMFVLLTGLFDLTHPWRTTAVRLLGNRLMHWLAEVSYGVYLFHGFALALIGGWLVRQPWYAQQPTAVRFPLLLTVVLAGTLGLATAIFRLVERPGIALGKRLTGARTLRASHSR